MFHSDLEVIQFGKEQQKDLLREATRMGMAHRIRRSRRIRITIWLGNQLIVLGERLKGGE